MSRNRAKSSHICLFLILITVATRIPFSSNYLYHLDSVNFALALESYHLSLHQPHPPGYFLYVMLGRLMHLLVEDANAAYVVISIIFSGLTAGALFLLAEEMYDRRSALLAGFFAITSPNLWFHGEVALSYGAEAFFSTLTALLSWKIYAGRNGFVWVTAICLGIAGGFRQNTMVFLLPLFLFAVRKEPAGKIAAALALLGAACLSWFAPMVWMTGGWTAYLGALSELWQFSTGHNSVLDQGMAAFRLYAQSLYNFTVYSMGTGIVATGIAAYMHLRHRHEQADSPGALFLAAWALPPVLFYLLVFVHPSNPGYALIFTPPLLLLSARSTLYVADEIRRLTGKDCTAWLASLLFLGNTLAFLLFTHQVSWQTIRGHDRQVSTVASALQSFDPATTVILVKSYLFYGFRQIMYYLPQYLVYQAELNVTEAERRDFFGGKGRETFRCRDIDVPLTTGCMVTILDKGDFHLARSIPSAQVRRLPVDLVLVSGPVQSMRQIYPELPFPAPPFHAKP